MTRIHEAGLDRLDEVRLTALPYSLDLALLASSLLPAEFFAATPDLLRVMN